MNEITPDTAPSAEEQLSHTDLLSGIFSNPIETFRRFVKQPLKTGDYMYPILTLVVAIVLSTNIIISNPVIADQMKQKQKEAVAKQLEEDVKKGKIDRATANERLAQTEEQFKMMSGWAGRLLTSVGILVSTAIMIVIICGFYFALIKFVLSDEITFKQTIVASALSGYISVLSVLANSIAAMLLDKSTTGITPLLFIHTEPKTVLYFFLSKIDPLTIWAYAVFAIALAAFTKQSVKKYLIFVFSVYLFWSALAFFVLSKLPFLGGLAGS